MSAANNKPIVKKAQELLKEYGHDVKTGHLYEVFSKLAGESNWNVANAKKTSFSNTILDQIDEEEQLPSYFSDIVVLSRNEYFQSIKKTNEFFALGTEVELKQLRLTNFLTMPHALFVGSMGSGKTVAAVSVVNHFLQTNPDRSSVFIIDNLMGASDYKKLFSLPQVYPVINSDSGVHRIIDLIHDEIVARKDAFNYAKAENYLDYEKKTGKKLNRCLLAFENFSAIIEPVLQFSMSHKTPMSSANKFKDIMRVGRSYGVFVIATSQRGTKSDIPAEIMSNFTTKAVFRVNKGESMYLTGSTDAANLGPEDKGKAYIDDTLVQFPCFSETEWDKMVATIKSQKNPNYSYLSNEMINDYLNGKSTENIYELKSSKQLFSNLFSYDTDLVIKVLLEKQEFKVKEASDKNLTFNISKGDQTSIVLVTNKIKAKDLEKLSASMKKENALGKVFFINEEVSIEEHSFAKALGIDILDLEDLKDLLLKDDTL